MSTAPPNQADTYNCTSGDDTYLRLNSSHLRGIGSNCYVEVGDRAATRDDGMQDHYVVALSPDSAIHAALHMLETAAASSKTTALDKHIVALQLAWAAHKNSAAPKGSNT